MSADGRKAAYDRSRTGTRAGGGGGGAVQRRAGRRCAGAGAGTGCAGTSPAARDPRRHRPRARLDGAGLALSRGQLRHAAVAAVVRADAPGCGAEPAPRPVAVAAPTPSRLRAVLPLGGGRVRGRRPVRAVGIHPASRRRSSTLGPGKTGHRGRLWRTRARRYDGSSVGSRAGRRRSPGAQRPLLGRARRRGSWSTRYASGPADARPAASAAPGVAVGRTAGAERSLGVDGSTA